MKHHDRFPTMFYRWLYRVTFVPFEDNWNQKVESSLHKTCCHWSCGSCRLVLQAFYFIVTKLCYWWCGFVDSTKETVCCCVNRCWIAGLSAILLNNQLTDLTMRAVKKKVWCLFDCATY